MSSPLFFWYLLEIQIEWVTPGMRCKSPKVIEMKPKPGLSGGEQMLVRCGYCSWCRLRRQSIWVARMLLEQRCHKFTYFVTLTYRECEVKDLETGYRDVQLFLKRLRKRFNSSNFRFFCCGEHGKLFQRPHWHLILYCDVAALRNRPAKAGVTWKSLGLKEPKFLRPVDVITELWGLGYTKTDLVLDDKKLRYVTKYMVKEPTNAKFTWSINLGCSRAYELGVQVARHTNQVPVVVRIGGRTYPIAGSLRRAVEAGILDSGRELPASVFELKEASYRNAVRRRNRELEHGTKEARWSKYWLSDHWRPFDPHYQASGPLGFPRAETPKGVPPRRGTWEPGDSEIASSEGCFDWPDSDS